MTDEQTTGTDWIEQTDRIPKRVQMPCDNGKAPAKVYLAYFGTYDEEGILGIFPDRESAMRAVREHGERGSDLTTEEVMRRIAEYEIGRVYT